MLKRDRKTHAAKLEGADNMILFGMIITVICLIVLFEVFFTWLPNIKPTHRPTHRPTQMETVRTFLGCWPVERISKEKLRKMYE
jgi:hypothetical protein